ncbi:hypothetical protein KPSA3_04434 [Pseudomonas syringae pv. actinidiae]|uniref:Uncharacterized protein n=1 Tax=Pseudomonas syringae pv. actinidiae TaxID=103796 RepID=A0AAN4Q702_PSESF|nr:hypothetical protein KPSA3_04434 [Pseudomonas syringae pv. actinidiae]
MVKKAKCLRNWPSFRLNLTTQCDSIDSYLSEYKPKSSAFGVIFFCSLQVDRCCASTDIEILGA